MTDLCRATAISHEYFISPLTTLGIRLQFTEATDVSSSFLLETQYEQLRQKICDYAYYTLQFIIPMFMQ